MPEAQLNRRTALHCMAWAGAGVLWTAQGGISRSTLISGAQAAETAPDFSFVQISDSHTGFSKRPNNDTPGTLREAIQHLSATKQNVAF